LLAEPQPDEKKSNMSNPADEAIETFKRWALAFNARDADTMVAEMHFPHLRLSGTEFQTWVTPDDFHSVQDAMTKALEKENWHITINKSITAIQSRPDKVHIAIRGSRQYEDGTEYNGFDTMWIFTKIEEKWGVQFRSSYLANAVQSFGASKPKF
jgi:hypothetical protein